MRPVSCCASQKMSYPCSTHPYDVVHIPGMVIYCNCSGPLGPHFPLLGGRVPPFFVCTADRTKDSCCITFSVCLWAQSALLLRCLPANGTFQHLALPSLTASSGLVGHSFREGGVKGENLCRQRGWHTT